MFSRLRLTILFLVILIIVLSVRTFINKPKNPQENKITGAKYKPLPGTSLPKNETDSKSYTTASTTVEQQEARSDDFDDCIQVDITGIVRDISGPLGNARVCIKNRESITFDGIIDYTDNYGNYKLKGLLKVSDYILVVQYDYCIPYTEEIEFTKGQNMIVKDFLLERIK